MFCGAVAVLVLFCATTSANLAETVESLEKQVRQLVDQRVQDAKRMDLLERALERTTVSNQQIVELKGEVEVLRRSVQSPTNQLRNDHLTLQWLHEAVSELRHELNEVASAQNLSAELQQRQQVESDLALLRSDVASFRKDLDELRAEQQTTTAEFSERESEATRRCDMLAAELKTVKAKWNAAVRTRKGSQVFSNQADNVSSDNSKHGSRSHTERKLRHGRMFQQIQDVEGREEELSNAYKTLEKRVDRLDKQTRLAMEDRPKSHAMKRYDYILKDIQERLSTMESVYRNSSRNSVNVSQKTEDLDRLHLSLLHLLESVQSLESSMDENVPKLQQEVSKLKFNMDQMNANMDAVNEKQINQQDTILSISQAVSSVQQQLRTEPQDTKVSSWTYPTFVQNSTENSKLNKSQPQTLQQLIQKLHHVRNIYDDIVHHLPKDCTAVGGRSGLYLVAPNPNEPLLASCDHESGAGGWTVIQRRSDGKVNFNRKWDEYKTGFGSPAGEFWIGNDVLHMLTHDNCSMLRVDLHDIYGASWFAEYTHFHVGAEKDGYRLHVSGYQGNASDALDYQNNMQFSTVDSDRDISNTNCAANYEGGWWFSHCQHVNLNGRFNLGLTWFDSSRNEWIAVASSELKIRRRFDCPKEENTQT